MKFSKKSIQQEDVKRLCKFYGLSPIEASIMVRRGITSGTDVLYHIEKDRRFMHRPFLLPSMEDAVDRINSAIEEGEKILIFGDRDVDGITSTAILYSYLKERGADVSYHLPSGEDSYGLSIPVIEEFAKNYGSLIITVDCGISNVKEVEYALSVNVDVIITDHHNPPEQLPESDIIIDPKLVNSIYPFKDISGAAVAFKLVQALRFSLSDFYAEDFALLDVRQEADKYRIDCIKVRNLIKTDYFSEVFKAGEERISDTKLPHFLQGQQILVWNAPVIKKSLFGIFGAGVEFQMLDIKPEVASIIPSIAGSGLSELKNISKIAHYIPEAKSEIEGFYNIFVTYVEKRLSEKSGDAADTKDLQLVAIAALADIMPMKNENRIFVKNGLAGINSDARRQGISELLALMDSAGRPITAADLSWKIIPSLNSAGRMGQTYTALELLIAEEPAKRENLAKKIMELNEQRKNLVVDGETATALQAKENFEAYGKKFCLVSSDAVNRGITGILSSKLMQKYNVPAVTITFIDGGNIAVGSMRSCRGCIATDFLGSFSELFINYGGHDYAAGFSLYKEQFDEFMERIKKAASNITLTGDDGEVNIDAELPAEYITPELSAIVSRFEPFGADNKELVFASKSLPLQEAAILGKTERQHLKLVFDCGKYKFPAMFWGEAERLNRDFKVGDKLNILYTLGKNYFKGTETPQMILIDAERAD